MPAMCRVTILSVSLLAGLLRVAAQPAYGPVGQVRIVPSALPPPFGFSENGDDRLALGGRTLKDALAGLLETAPLQVDFPAELDDGKLYDFSVQVAPADRGRVPELFRQAIELRFGLTITREDRLMDVYALTAPHADKLQTGHCCTGQMMSTRLALATTPRGDNSLEGREATMKVLAQALEPHLGRPVLDETGLNGGFNFTCVAKGQGDEAVMRMLQECGLALIPDKRGVEMIVVRQRR
jgi:uncharacterized protein (TIGR03435 family)